MDGRDVVVGKGKNHLLKVDRERRSSRMSREDSIMTDIVKKTYGLLMDKEFEQKEDICMTQSEFSVKIAGIAAGSKDAFMAVWDCIRFLLCLR
jgi:hypothetical protein